MKKLTHVVLPVLLMSALFILTPVFSRAGESPIKGGGNFGLGLELGNPGTWGADGKVWIDRQNAFQPAFKFGDGASILQLDYLWHYYDLVHPKNGLLPFYLGVGGNLSLNGTVVLGARGVAGISYLFDRSDVPVDIYLQAAPTIWFFTGDTTFSVYGELGSRYYF